MKMILGSLLLLASSAHAGLVGLNNQQLGEINGQGGADLNWTLSLNHKITTDGSLSREYECKDAASVYCRLAISANNRKDANGNLYWLVFKQLQGTLQLEKFQLDGVSVGGGTKTALQLRFGIDDKGNYLQPLKIRNFGYAALQIEKDSGATTTNPATAANKGYLNISNYPNVSSTFTSAFDAGKETGFTGLNVHGNLALAGTLKVFGCNGSNGSRC